MNREEQLRCNANMILLDYWLNMDSSNGLMTANELLEHVYASVFDIKCSSHEQLAHGKGICADLKFLGKARMDEIILELGKKNELLKE